MTDITWCVSPDCPSKDCAIHICNHPQIKDEHQMISMADFSGVCRYYIGRVLIGKLMMYGGEYVYTQTAIDDAPTIIESEEEDG